MTLRPPLQTLEQPREPDAGYVIHGELARGGMGIVCLGRRRGAHGFSRSVAIKRLHAELAQDEAFVAMFCNEARLAAHIHHANVVPTLDVAWSDVGSAKELLLVMEYVHGESLSRLLAAALARGQTITLKLAVTLLSGVLHGLHAAHETKGEHGEALHIEHCDVSPENILVGVDGVPRVLDFGIARAREHSRETHGGELRGKLSYMAPERLRAESSDRRADVYSASVVLWETLTGRRLFEAPSQGVLLANVLMGTLTPPSALREHVPPALDAIVLKGLAREPAARFQTALEMAHALEREVGTVGQSEVSAWLLDLAGASLAARAQRIAHLEDQRNHGANADDASISTPQTTRRVPVAPSSAPLPAVTPPAPAQTRRLRLAAAVALVGSAILLVLINLVGPAREPTRARVLADSHPARLAPPSPPPAASASGPIHATRAPASEPDTRDLTVKPARNLRPLASPRRNVHPAREIPAKPAVSPTPAPDCSPPYVVDKLGIRHPKLDCL